MSVTISWSQFLDESTGMGLTISEFKFDDNLNIFLLFSCDRETTFCLMSDKNISAPRGKYTCICRDRFYLPNESLQGFTSAQVEGSSNGTASTTSSSSGLNGNFSCLPCPGACFCDSTGQCLFGDDLDSFSTETLFKAIIGVVLGSCMFCCVVLAIIVAQQRKCKTIATGMWTVLETILLGIFLLYLAVSMHTLQKNIYCLNQIISAFRCNKRCKLIFFNFHFDSQ